MDLPDQNSPAFGAVMRSKSHAANTALTLAARVNDANLKERTLDKLSELVDIIKDEERRRLPL
jgi:hypothetical protein